jgi:hypothetical protein
MALKVLFLYFFPPSEHSLHLFVLVMSIYNLGFDTTQRQSIGKSSERKRNTAN